MVQNTKMPVICVVRPKIGGWNVESGIPRWRRLIRYSVQWNVEKQKQTRGALSSSKVLLRYWNVCSESALKRQRRSFLTPPLKQKFDSIEIYHLAYVVRVDFNFFFSFAFLCCFFAFCHDPFAHCCEKYGLTVLLPPIGNRDDTLSAQHRHLFRPKSIICALCFEQKSSFIHCVQRAIIRTVYSIHISYSDDHISRVSRNEKYSHILSTNELMCTPL